eukprot:TRINITY_DN3368_c5_g1_i1.p1 TRINITY_DN3368_c5_g1~~TRINITY_DN3368_c5_g1_i1.p1  ORF type:complete len:276 (+),score=43.58 TRINITY_DN3368_c5_g1_i1:42-869(+)
MADAKLILALVFVSIGGWGLYSSMGGNEDGAVIESRIQAIREELKQLRIPNDNPHREEAKSEVIEKTTPPADFDWRIKWRWQIGQLLESEGKLHGAELGVQLGKFSQMILSNWPSCKSYMLVDVWDLSDNANYRDAANVGKEKQGVIYRKMLENLDPYKNQLIINRNFSHNASLSVPPNSLDFVYVDARHDYESVLEDMRDWWTKLRPGGILAGHDFTSARSVRGYGVQRDGSWDQRAVRGAVVQFSQEVNRGFMVIPDTKNWRKVPFSSWILRK